MSPNGTPLSSTSSPNGLWCADFKGEFMLGNRQYCYPLTVTDYSSRFLLACEGLESTQSTFAFAVFERVFKEYGLPQAIRTDNGVPFASPNALFGLSRLSVWWLRLGINLERIKPGHPQQNGRHERLHLTLKKEATKPASYNFLQQQRRFDDFLEVYNCERPHQALNGRYPAELYTPSPRAYRAPGIQPSLTSLPARSAYPVRPHLHRQAQDQPQHRVCRTIRGHSRGRRQDLACQFPRLRSRVFRRGRRTG
jgi:putative transposase